MTTMKKLSLIGIVMLAFGYFNVLPCQAQHTIEGNWIGGIGFGREWQAVGFSFKGEGGSITGTLDFPGQNRIGLALNRVVFESPHVHIAWQGRTDVAIFDGLFEGQSISGEFVQGERRAKFGLVRVAKASPRLNEEYSGSYQLSPDRFIDMGPIGDHIRFVDSRTRLTRYLYPSSETSFFSGPSIGIPFPVELRVTFLKNKQGKVSGLIWKENEGRLLQAKPLPYKEEEVTYHYGDATV